MLLITFLTQRKNFDQVLVNFLSEISNQSVISITINIFCDRESNEERHTQDRLIGCGGIAQEHWKGIRRIATRVM